MLRMAGKKVLITGAGSGIGRQCAMAFLKSGATVALSGSNVTKLEEARASMVAEFENDIFLVPCDLANAEATAGLVNETVSVMGDLDVLVCNAGITRNQLTIRTKLEDWDQVMAINLTAAFLLNKSANAHFMRKKWGRIVNISSVVASSGNAGQAAYCASKGGLEAMTRSLALEFASRGININCVAPGFIETAMTHDLPQDLRDELLKKIPLGRLGAAHDVAGAVLFLCSHLADYITGQVLHVNGGMLMN
jgi:3-oxoacyl-[acyl-carrier protein] reductase